MMRENLDNVRKNIRKACEASNRSTMDVNLIAVSKTKPVEAIREIYDGGVRDFGENKVQEILKKIDRLPKDIRWHMIGHLQRNKVKDIINRVCMIHSVDSVALAQEISKEGIRAGACMDILLEVNISGEESKYGFTPQEIAAVTEQIASLPGVSVKGLMTVAPYTENPEENRVFFRKLKQLSVDINEKNIDNVSMEVLSMGMTGDYEVAISEGATHVRVGTGIFGERDYSK